MFFQTFKVDVLLIILNVINSLGKSIPNQNEALVDCIKAPERVLIECKLLNVQQATCLGTNLIVVPVTEENKDGQLNCTASTPIDVSFEGFQLKDYANLTYVRNAEHVFNEATFVFSIGLSLNGLNTSRKVKIAMLSNPEMNLELFIFRPGGKIFSTLQEKENPSRLPYSERNLVIPCISNDPEIEPLLEFESVKENSTLTNLKTFERTKGFIIKTEVDGRKLVDPSGAYKCTAGNGEPRETLHFYIEPKGNYTVEPKMDKIYLFHNGELKVSCQSDEIVKLEGVFKNSSINSKSFASDTSVFPLGSEYVEKQVRIGDSGTIQCKTKDSEQVVLHTWNIQTLDIRNNSVLQLNKLNDTLIECQSQQGEGQLNLEAVFCQGETECKLNQFCLDNSVNRKTNYFFLKWGTREINASCKHRFVGSPSACNSTSNVNGVGVHSNGANRVCLSLPQTNQFASQGMIRCSKGDYSYKTNYFRGFDNKLYLDWEEAPISALVSIFVPNTTMFPHNFYPFGCKAAKFISDGKLQWVIRGKDGSEILLHKNRVEDLYGVYASPLDYDLYTVRESNIKLVYPNDYDIICMVPRWNATAFIRHHQRINVAAKVAPVAEIVAGSATVIAVLIGVVIYVAWRLKKAKDAIRNLTEKEVQEFLDGNPEALKHSAEKDAHEVVDALPYDSSFEIPREKLIIDRENLLGKGAFGTVLKGRVEGVTHVVAVKTVSSDCEVNRFKGFLSELKIMIYIGKHPNIVSLIGATTEKIKEKTLYIVVEYCVNGSLESFLRKSKGCFVNQIVDNQINPGAVSYENTTPSSSEDLVVTSLDLIKWSYQVAKGMEFLESKKVVHADLASRNVLVNENRVCKITDFGLSRQLFDYTQYVKKQQEPLPWRWMAPESLQQLRFSSPSDVWAFGVLLWEIFSLGDVPYPGLSWDIHFVQRLCDGLRLNRPAYCTTHFYNDMMLQCWQQESDARPTFPFIAQYLRSLLETLSVDVLAFNYLTPLDTDDKIQSGTLSSTPGYLSVVDLVDIDTESDRKTTNIYINS